MRGNQRQIMNLLASIFGGGKISGVGEISNTKQSSFQSVQAQPNANPLSEEEKLKKKREKEDKKKKKRTNIVAETKKPTAPALNNKMPASNLGSLKIGLNLNTNKTPAGAKKKPTASGLNYQ